MKIAIVGGGLSLNDIDLSTIKPRHDLTIAINSTAWLMDCDVCFTLSKRFALRNNYGNGQPFRFVFAVRDRWRGFHPCETLRVREGIETHYKSEHKALLMSDGGRLGLSKSEGVVHGGNSAYSALNWAYLLGAEEISLFGVDATDKVRSNGSSGNHAHLPELFTSAMPHLNGKSIKTVNYSLDSRIMCFEKKEWLPGSHPLK